MQVHAKDRRRKFAKAAKIDLMPILFVFLAGFAPDLRTSA